MNIRFLRKALEIAQNESVYLDGKIKETELVQGEHLEYNHYGQIIKYNKEDFLMILKVKKERADNAIAAIQKQLEKI
jgi:hypothetical protein